MMRRILVLATVALVMATMIVAMAMPAFAVPPVDDDGPNCLGEQFSFFATTDEFGGMTVGENVRPFAQNGGLGQQLSAENRSSLSFC